MFRFFYSVLVALVLVVCLTTATTTTTPSRASLLGPSHFSYYNSIFQGNDGKTPCKVCTINCKDFKVFSTCKYQYYNYGCHLKSNCLSATSASSSEIATGMAFCFMFNECNLKRKFLNTRVLRKHVTKLQTATTKRLLSMAKCGAKFDLQSMRSGFYFTMPPYFFLRFKLIQDMKDSIVNRNTKYFAFHKNSFVFSTVGKQWLQGSRRFRNVKNGGTSMQRLLALPQTMVFFSYHRMRRYWNDFFANVRKQVLLPNNPSKNTYEDATLDKIKAASERKLALYNQIQAEEKKVAPAKNERLLAALKQQFYATRINLKDLNVTSPKGPQPITVEMKQRGYLNFVKGFFKRQKELCRFFHGPVQCSKSFDKFDGSL